MEDTTNRKILSLVCHVSVFFTSTVAAVAVPLVILFVSDDSIVKANAKESLNFQINLFVYGIVFIILTFVLIGIPLLILLGIANLILPILAIVKVIDRPDVPYHYPFIFRVL